jgi:putative endonuclease
MTAPIKPYIPFMIVYYEEFQTLSEAILREKYFETAAGRRFIKKVLPKFNARPADASRTGIE